mmetsp:Transcript_28035/g.90948  ORF Transcript_28035/g.90948 Transcript_28035/m.90948 type:complete len:224 (-) Transcript_28035:503-1174(-)
MAHEVVIVHHLPHRQREGDGDGERKPFGYRNDKDGNTRDKIVEYLRQVYAVDPPFLAALPADETHGKPREEHEDCQDTCCCSYLGDRCRHAVQLQLKYALLASLHVLLHRLLYARLVRARPHRQHHHLPLPFLHERPGEDSRRKEMSARSTETASLPLGRRLPCKTLLGDLQVTLVQYDPVSTYHIAGTEQDDIADNKILVQDLLYCTVSDDSHPHLLLYFSE